MSAPQLVLAGCAAWIAADVVVVLVLARLSRKGRAQR